MNTNKVDKIVKVSILSSVILASLSPVIAYADESNLKIPELSSSQNGTLMMGLVICLLGMAFGYYQFLRVKKIKAHKSMLDVSAIIFETCKTYLIQQGKFIAILFLIIGSIIAFYFGYLQGTSFGGVLLVLGWTIVGILGSYGDRKSVV